MKIIQSFILMKLFFLYIGQARDKKSIKNEITFIITNILITLEYNPYPFIIRTLGRFPDFEVTNCQPFLLLYSALICFLGNSI